MNNVILIGRLTKDADIRTSQSGMTVARFTLAVNRRKKDEADFISCLAFDKTADLIGKYFHKGSRAGVRGHIQTGSYKAQDGKTIYTTDVIVDELDFIETKSEGSKPIDGPAHGVPEGFTSIPDNADDEELPWN